MHYDLYILIYFDDANPKLFCREEPYKIVKFII